VWLQLAKAHAVKDESTRSYQGALSEVARAQSAAGAATATAADPMETTARRLRKSLREIDNVRWRPKVRARL
jgi:hypothetical protein